MAWVISGVNAADVITALALVEAHCGFEPGSLSNGQTVTEAYVPRLSSFACPIRRGPIQTLANVTLDGVSRVSRFERFGWHGLRVKQSVARDDLDTAGIPAGAFLEATFVQGWATITANTPNVLVQAVTMIAGSIAEANALNAASVAALNANPSGIRVDEVDDLKLEYQSASDLARAALVNSQNAGGLITPVIETMLRAFKRPAIV